MKRIAFFLFLFTTTFLSYGQNCACYWTDLTTGFPDCELYGNCSQTNRTNCENILSNPDNDGAFAQPNTDPDIEVPSDYDGDLCDFIINELMSAPLPVTLGSFTVSHSNTEENTNRIEWFTYTERNNHYFTLEYSHDGINWKTIYQIAGAGNSIEKQFYYKEHTVATNTISYYKLSQTDFDGTKEVFPVISIKNNEIPKIIGYFNTIGQKVERNTPGIVIEVFEDGNTVKRINN